MSLIVPKKNWDLAEGATASFRGGWNSRKQLVIDKFSSCDLIENMSMTQFKHIFSVNDFRFSGKLINELLLHKVNTDQDDEIQFLLGGKVCHFGRREFGLMTGLEFGEDLLIDKEKDGLINTHFPKDIYNDNVNFKKLEIAFKKADKKEDIWRLGLVYYVEGILIGTSDTKNIDIDLLYLADDPNLFCRYPWGSRLFRMTFIDLKKDMKTFCMERSQSSVYSLCGFIPALQYWAFETVPKLGDKFASYNGDEFPRIRSWTCKTTMSEEKVRDILRLPHSELEVRPFLQPRPEELTYLIRQCIVGPPVGDVDPLDAATDIDDSPDVAAPVDACDPVPVDACDADEDKRLLYMEQEMDRLKRDNVLLTNTVALMFESLKLQSQLIKSMKKR